MKNTPLSHALIAISALLYAMPDIVNLFLHWVVPKMLYDSNYGISAGYQAFLRVGDGCEWLALMLFVLAISLWCFEHCTRSVDASGY